MTGLLVFLFGLLGLTSGHYIRRGRCFFSASGKKARFLESRTTFKVFNTFAAVQSNLTLLVTGRRRRKTYLKFLLPSRAVISRLDFEEAGVLYAGQVYTVAQATQKFKEKNPNSKVQLVQQWSNEQFKSIQLKLKLLPGFTSVILGWEYLIPLEHNRYRLFFPLNIPRSYENSVVSVKGQICEQKDINFLEVGSPQPSNFWTGPVVTRADAQNVDISFEASYKNIKKWWNSDRWRLNYLYWNYWHYPRPHSGGYRSIIQRARYYLYWRSRRSSYQYDMVFSLLYNHTLGQPYQTPTHRFFNGYIHGECIIHAINVNQLLLQSVQNTTGQDPFNIYPNIRRATFFVDDNFKVASSYYAQVKLALNTVLRWGGNVTRLSPFPPASGRDILDTKTFNRFRIVVLQTDGSVSKFPPECPGCALFAVPNETLPGSTSPLTALELGMEFVNNLPTSYRMNNRMTFGKTIVEFEKVMDQYNALAVSLGDDGKHEVSDIFYFANKKPKGVGGNFISAQRKVFVDRVAKAQQNLKTFTGRTYGQPIFTYGFGPNADYNLLDALSSNNDGSTRMAFKSQSNETIVDQALSFFEGIGRVIASDIHISTITLQYGSFVKTLIPDVEHSLTESGFNIPIMRDLEEYFIFFKAPEQNLGVAFNRFFYNLTFIPAGEEMRNTPTGTANAKKTWLLSDFDTYDDLSVQAALDMTGLLCKQGEVIRLLTAEQANRRLAASKPVTKTQAEITTLIETIAVNASLQSSATSFYVENIEEMIVEPEADGAGQFVTDGSSTSSAARLGVCAVFGALVAFVLLLF